MLRLTWWGIVSFGENKPTKPKKVDGGVLLMPKIHKDTPLSKVQ
jgi:hypothetical protein